MPNSDLIPPEFPRPQAVDQIPARGHAVTLTADSSECAALALRLDLQSVRALSAKVELTPLGRTGKVRVRGSFSAEVVQTCGVTLAPLPAHVEDDFELTFAPPELVVDEDSEIELSWDRQDPPDPIIDGTIDLGEVVAEHLALALDPFPRAPDAAFQPPFEPPEMPEERPNPFAVLASLRQKGE
ncbi:conserved hypothetical protein [Candidatus Terasakiella magnetica]|nr:conserved hypothetical protein [Candidatus Terasakiella magnetica]